MKKAGSESIITTMIMIISHIEKPIEPFGSADAVWNFCGRRERLGNVEELDAFMDRVDDSGDVITSQILLYPISGARAAPEF